MGRKVHPIVYRLGYTKRWSSTWYAEKEYCGLLQEDVSIRDLIRKFLENPGGQREQRGGGRRRGIGAGVSKIEIERQASQVRIVVHTARPGIVIGRGGTNRESMQRLIGRSTGKQTSLDVREISQPELDAFLVVRNVAEQLERRVSFRRAIKMTAERSMRAGALGIKIMVGGRLGGREMARSEFELLGTVPLQTLDADIDYGFSEARTQYGRIGVKAWIHRGVAQQADEAAAVRHRPVGPGKGGRRAPRS